MAEKKVKESRVKGNSFGASGFTLGIIGVLSPGGVGLLVSIIGFIFCLIQQKKRPTKLGKAGLIINVAGFIFSIAYLVWLFFLGGMQYLQSLNTSLVA
jgi:hypothetical protein